RFLDFARLTYTSMTFRDRDRCGAGPRRALTSLVDDPLRCRGRGRGRACSTLPGVGANICSLAEGSSVLDPPAKRLSAGPRPAQSSSRGPVYAAAAVAALLLTACNAPKAQTAGAPAAVPVSVATATQESLPVEIRAIGAVEASETVQIKSQVAGELTGVRFVEGADVNTGDLLLEIDPRPYREAMRQAEAALARDNAQLRQAEANLARDVAQSKFASADAARYEDLAKAGVVSRTQSDQSRTNADALRESSRAGQAAIESARAAIDSDRAAIDRAKLDLTYCEIRSPISGRA